MPDASIIGLRELARVDPVPHPVTLWMTSKALWLIQAVYGGVKVELEDFPDLREPVLFAMNHSHYFDFMPSRFALFTQKGIQTASFVKARAFQNRLEAAYVKSIGNVPLVSRGYLISADFKQVHGRGPDEGEYRILREHVDHAVPLPDEPLYRDLRSTARDMLDVGYDPHTSSYGDAIRACYAAAMATSVGQARAAVAANVYLHIYPQGLFSTRLSQGRSGAVQFAVALDIPIVPVGFSGMNELFPKNHMVPHTRGSLTMRFGQPYRIQRAELAGFEPFVPREEQRLRAVLDDETMILMNKINALLDPQYRWGEDLAGDGLEGVSRFFDS